MPITTHTHTVTPEQAGRVDHVVRDLTGLSRSKLRGLFEHGCVAINDTVCSDVFVRVAEGDVIEVKFDSHQGYKEKPKIWEDSAFKIVHEDDDIIVCLLYTSPSPRDRG